MQRDHTSDGSVHRSAGFALIELLVVISIIADQIYAGVVSSGGGDYSRDILGSDQF